MDKQRLRLYQQILDNPNDDQIRLIYADYLEEYGTEDWELKQAEYIRLAIENRNITYEKRGKLVNKYGKMWGWLKYHTIHFTRGFPSRITIPENPKHKSVEDYITYINDHPIQYMLIHKITTKQIELLMKQPRYKHIKEIAIMSFEANGNRTIHNEKVIRRFIKNKTKIEIPDNMFLYITDHYNYLRKLKNNGLESIGLSPSDPINRNPIINDTFAIATQMGLEWIYHTKNWIPGE